MPAAMVYTCRATNWPVLWIDIFGVVLATYLGLVSYSVVLRFLFTALMIIALVKAIVEASQRVSAGPDGLTVNLGAFGFPRVTVARANIARAEIVDLPVTLRSRWGTYWTRKREWFLTPNMGPALRLTLASGRMVTVSMPEPAAALAAMGIITTDRWG
ncbi:hypothetical protein ACQPW1_19665 [Nocardia sp. CA-128927]|uniref:hypothetical protein n=1 Tax=Nocardia sp. CA-128927 TaxID=3239975 RepID=UPI003D98BAC8